MHICRILQRRLVSADSVSEFMFYSAVSPSRHSDSLRRCAVDSQAWTCHHSAPNLIHITHTHMHTRRIKLKDTHSYWYCQINPNTQYSKYMRSHTHTHSWMLSIHKARSRGTRKSSAVTTDQWQAKFITQPHWITDEKESGRMEKRVTSKTWLAHQRLPH